MSSIPSEALSDRWESQEQQEKKPSTTNVNLGINESIFDTKEPLKHDSFSDIDIYAGEKMELIQCHRFVLAKHSTVLCTMLSSRWQSDGMKSAELYLPADDPEGFRNLIQYMYNGNLKSDISTTTLINTLDLAKKYDIPQLAEKVTCKLLDEITVQNALSIYFAGKLYDVDNIKDKAFEVISTDTPEVILSEEFLQLDYENLFEFLSFDELRVCEVQLLQAVCRWSEVSCEAQHLEITPENCRLVLKNALQLIRYNEMSPEQFTEIAECKELYEPWEKYEILHELTNCPPREKKPKLTFDYNKNPRFSLIETIEATALFLFKHKKEDLRNNGLATTFFKVNKIITLHTLGVFLPKKRCGGNFNRAHKVKVIVDIREESNSANKENNGIRAMGFFKLDWTKPTYCKFKFEKLVHLTPGIFYKISFNVEPGPASFKDTNSKNLVKTEFRMKCNTTDIIFSFKSPVQDMETIQGTRSGETVKIVEKLSFQLPQLSFLLGAGK